MQLFLFTHTPCMAVNWVRERKINAITPKRSFVLGLHDFKDESYKLGRREYFKLENESPTTTISLDPRSLQKALLDGGAF